MTETKLSPAFLPQTVLAVRDAPGAPWRMLALRCEQGDLPEQIANLGLDAAEKRFVGASRVHPDYWEQFIVANALKRGWHQGVQSDAWFPVEEPLPLPSSSPVRAEVTLSLRSIRSGSIHVAIEVEAERHDVYFDDIEDELVIFARFVQVLVRGGQPHAALTDSAMSHFAVHDAPEPHLCRLRLKISQNDGDHHRHFDVLTDRQRLVEQFRSLAGAIADHANLGHHFLCHCCLPDSEYDRVGDAAEAEWKLGVTEGRFPDDFESEKDFIASRLVSGVRLPPDCAQLTDQYRAMLRTLEIPDEWLVRYGLASMAVQTSGNA